ncbi:NTP transferase domain-containing protein [Campylobacter fetus]|uniref:NTP transferase domain-containing protein n=1 Tax=Campylobacter fetus TaxID=196 RepID=UPI003AF6E0BC
MKNALILAGGKSSRMGSDKTLLAYKDYPSITHFLFERLSKIFKDVKISAKNDKFEPKLPILVDDFDDFSALKVIANLDKNYNEPVFIIAADTPFVKFETIKELYLNLKNNDISLPKGSEFVHGLCGFYNPKVSLAAQSLLKNGMQKIALLRDLCPTVITEFKDKKQFLNLNTQAEYELIK